MHGKHVFEVVVIRYRCEEDYIRRYSAETYSIRANGDLTANKLSMAIADDIRAQARDSVDSTEVYRVVDGKRERMSTADKYRANRIKYGRGRRY